MQSAEAGSTLMIGFGIPESVHERLIAELSEIGFEAFESEPGKLIAYGTPDLWSPANEQLLLFWLSSNGCSLRMDREIIPAQNWNAEWESQIKSIEVGPFLVTPSWRISEATSSDKVVIYVDPKMSFGTGYHESTRIALRLLAEQDLTGQFLLDAGTGTGILAIAAIKLGCSAAVGFDIDEWSIRNAMENVRSNAVNSKLEVRQGNIDVITEREIPCIVANMIRSNLEPMLDDFVELLSHDGRLLLSGLLKSERSDVSLALEGLRLEIVGEAIENEWWGCVCRRT